MRLSLLCLALLVTLAGYSQTNHLVEVNSNFFDPPNLTIAVGDTVTWDNVNGVHNVNGSLATYPDNPVGFDNGNATSPGADNWPYQFVFTQAGLYDYQCDPHAALGMVGTVNVVAAPSVIITEIMYNPPESGTDSLEYIELYNAGTETVEMEGYSFTQGVEYTFPPFTLQPGDFVVVAVDSAALENNFGVPAFQWTSGGLSNGGETITIADADGNPLNSVNYDDNPPWPTAADGGGSSIGLCDFTADNTLAENWSTSTNDTGIDINGNSLLGDPGATTNCAVATPMISFTTGAFGVDEGDGTAQVRILVQNAEGLTISGELSLDASATATEGEDFDLGGPAFPQTFNFTATDNLDTVFLDINIIDDMDVEEDETIVLNLGNPSTGVTVGQPDQLRIFINNNDFDTNISPVNEVDSIDVNGVATRQGDLVTVQGVVYGEDLRGGDGLLFTLIDENNDGIAIFNSGQNFGYEVQEGDEIIVTGEVSQFRGLMQIAADAIEFVDAGNTLFEPTVVTTLDESTESQLVTFNDLTFIDPTQFDGASAAFNVDVVSPAMDTFVIRFYFDPTIDVPAGEVLTGISLTGIGGQFDTSEPFLDGYQISPRYAEDVTFNFTVSTEEPSWAQTVELYPNPVRDFLRVQTPVVIDQALLIGTDGRILRNWQPRADQLDINTADLAAGVYYLRLFGEGQWLTRKVLKH